jgi:NTP pyrophosphatase (non-canonical NTP hydrolase)
MTLVPASAHSKFSLDDLYLMVSTIYSEQNALRSPSATFGHFVETCGMLTAYDRKKKREDLNIEDALCKSLGWFFPLLAKFRVASVESLIFRKFPYACPYCRQCPHKDSICKTTQGTRRTVDHRAVLAKHAENSHKRPHGLNEWQQMFNDIYERDTVTANSGRSSLGLLEEVGELAEAVRVFEKHPKYFAGEAADVFSYLMGFANEHRLRLEIDSQPPFDFEAAFLLRYPGLCMQCGYPVCVCPSIPESTVGRMAKELDLASTNELFTLNPLRGGRARKADWIFHPAGTGWTACCGAQTTYR